MKEIWVKYGVRTLLAKKYKCSNNFVKLALNYKKNSLKAKMIRHAALEEFKGVKVEI